jgi:hypothetical protein
MIDRLAKVIYWTACGVAAFVAAFSLYVISDGSLPSPGEAFAACAVASGLIRLAGRAIRYVLTGI